MELGSLGWCANAQLLQFLSLLRLRFNVPHVAALARGTAALHTGRINKSALTSKARESVAKTGVPAERDSVEC